MKQQQKLTNYRDLKFQVLSQNFSQDFEELIEKIYRRLRRKNK